MHAEKKVLQKGSESDDARVIARAYFAIGVQRFSGGLNIQKAIMQEEIVHGSGKKFLMAIFFSGHNDLRTVVLHFLLLPFPWMQFCIAATAVIDWERSK